jgi:hypothetical protein
LVGRAALDEMRALVGHALDVNLEDRLPAKQRARGTTDRMGQERTDLQQRESEYIANGKAKHVAAKYI